MCFPVGEGKHGRGSTDEGGEGARERGVARGVVARGVAMGCVGRLAVVMVHG